MISREPLGSVLFDESLLGQPLHGSSPCPGAPQGVSGGDEIRVTLVELVQEALQVVAELNTGYHPPEQVRALLARLTGRAVDDSVTVFPPFYSEFSKT